MRTLKLVVPAGLVVAGFLFCTATSFGTPAYLAKEKKTNAAVTSCAYCHVKTGAPDAMKKDPNLNDTGTCYQKNDHSLAKCPPPPKK
jgi:cytochrome c553